MDYVPFHELTGRPNVIADGASRRSTVLTLSHWPRSGTPWPLKADLSAEIAFNYLGDHEAAVDVDAVSNDHLDVDGFVSVFALARPDVALRHRSTLIETARAGDFGTTTDATGRRLAAAIAAFTRPATCPLDPSLFEQQRPLQVATLYRELLDRVPAWLDDPSAAQALWQDEDDAFEAAEAAFAAGGVTLTEHPDPATDLAVVDVDPSVRLGREFPSTLQIWGPLHPVAVHNRTDRLRVVYRSGRRVGLLYRFESWVQLTSRTPAPRIDLAPLAADLAAPGSDGADWTWAWPNNPNPPVPWLRSSAPGRLNGDELVDRIAEYLQRHADDEPGPDVYDPRPYGASTLPGGRVRG